MKTDIPLPTFSSQPSCTQCDLHQGAKSPGVPTRFYKQSEPSSNRPPLIVVGMNPGYQEDQENKCFVGPSGNLLTKVYLNHEEMLKSPIYLTNAARCATLVKNETPKRKHYKQCFVYLHEDIETIIKHHGKAFLLCLGSHAYGVISQYLLGKAKSLRHGFSNQGQPAELLFNNQINIYATFHPSAVLRERKYLYPVSDHIDLLGRAMSGKLPTPSNPNIIEPMYPGALK